MLSTIPDHIRKDTALANRLRVIIEHLKLAFSPVKIILFGSYARGDFREGSTLNIFIIANTEARFVERIRSAIEVTGGTPAVEPIVYTPEEFQLMQDQGEGFIASAINEGVLLYEKVDGAEQVNL